MFNILESQEVWIGGCNHENINETLNAQKNPRIALKAIFLAIKEEDKIQDKRSPTLCLMMGSKSLQISATLIMSKEYQWPR